MIDATRGFGQHFWDVPPRNILMLRKVWSIHFILNKSFIQTAVLYLSNILRYRSELSKILYPASLPSNISGQTISVADEVCHGLDGLSYHRIGRSGVISMHSCWLCVGYLGVWEMHQFSSFRLRRCWVKYFGGHCHHSSPYVGAESFETRFEKENRSRIHVYTWILVSRSTFWYNSFLTLLSSACVTSLIRLKYIISYGTSIDLTCKLVPWNLNSLT